MRWAPLRSACSACGWGCRGGGEGEAMEAPVGEARGRPSRTLLWPLAVFCALAAIFALALRSGDPSRLPSALIGKTAPQIALAALPDLVDGSRPVPGFASNELKGHASVVNFWASWCEPCEQEHPLLLALQARGVLIYGVNYKDHASVARRFLGRRPPPPLPPARAIRSRRSASTAAGGRPSSGASMGCPRPSSSMPRVWSS